jgi:protein-disulfide isomerase
MKNYGFHIIFVSALILVGPRVSSAQDSQKAVATVDGQAIYEQDLMSVAGPNLLELHKQEFKVKSDALSSLIRKKLVEAAAKKKGLTAEELLKQEVDSKIAEPSDDEAKGYYLAAKSGTSLPFDQIKSQVKQLLKNTEIQQAREKYTDSLRDKAEVSILLQPPSVQVEYDPARVKGSADTPVTIVEFADFQCPYCGKVEPTLRDVLAKYNGRVKLAYRDFPLSQIHEHAEVAAEASRCALAQGKYWEMHDAMFADQAKLDEADLVKTAAGLGMDRNSFESCLKSGKYKTMVQQDVEAGSEVGVSATPTFFINGEFLSGAQSSADFVAIIDRQLAAAMARDRSSPRAESLHRACRSPLGSRRASEPAAEIPSVVEGPQLKKWSGRMDLNHRPPGPEPGALARLRYAPTVGIPFFPL